MHHSDRGSQNASEQFERLMADSIAFSMSRSGNLWDNVQRGVSVQRLAPRTHFGSCVGTLQPISWITSYFHRFKARWRKRKKRKFLSPIFRQTKCGARA
jgi:transposase InsO family protein